MHNVTRLGIAKEIVSKSFNNIEIGFIDFGGGETFWYPYYGNTKSEQMTEYINIVKDCIEHFTRMMGDWPGGSRYWISTPAIEEQEVATAWSRWMRAWPKERYNQVPHHVLHAWIWFSSDANIRSNAPEFQWVLEGIPTFYEHHSPLKLTGNSKRKGMAYINYLTVKRAEQFGYLQDTTINTYAYSEMRALALDRIVRESTNEDKSIDDLLKLLNQRFGDRGVGITREELIQAINDIVGIDLTQFYMKYLAEETSSDLPPVDSYMVEYENDFLTWIDTYVSETGLGSEARGSRTMFFISLEMAIQERNGDEHYIATGGHLFSLQEFKSALEQIDSTLTESDIINVLSSITGVPEDDFFTFYTVGNYRPSVDEVRKWLLADASTGGDGGGGTTVASEGGGGGGG